MARRCCSTDGVRYSTVNWANTPAGRPQVIAGAGHCGMNPHVLSGPDLIAIDSATRRSWSKKRVRLERELASPREAIHCESDYGAVIVSNVYIRGER